jgi:hypothetical protein
MYKMTQPAPGTHLMTPERNRYFYGKLMDVYHFELEQEYFNTKRCLLNRLITGYGVVCRLDVEVTYNGKWGVIVQSGVAIDRCGREIIVTEDSRPEPLPLFPQYNHAKAKPQVRGEYEGERRHYCEEEYAHVVLCYHECESDPVPALASDCESPALCAPGSIREKYKIEIRDKFASKKRKPSFPDVIEGGRINYSALVEYVTKDCRPAPRDCCIPLANILLHDSGSGWEPEVDITIRPIVYTNRLLFDLIMSLRREEETE